MAHATKLTICSPIHTAEPNIRHQQAYCVLRSNHLYALYTHERPYTIGCRCVRAVVQFLCDARCSRYMPMGTTTHTHGGSTCPNTLKSQQKKLKQMTVDRTRSVCHWKLCYKQISFSVSWSVVFSLLTKSVGFSSAFYFDSWNEESEQIWIDQQKNHSHFIRKKKFELQFYAKDYVLAK